MRRVDPKYFLVLAVILVMGWFAFGFIYNLRRGESILRWMQSGLPRIGERTTLRWLGTSVAELVIARAKGPFRRLEMLVVLAPRDVPWIWMLSRLQGRRDTLIFRAQLSIPPRLDLELADPSSWTGRMALQQAAQKGWESQPFQEMQLMAPSGRLNLASTILARLDGPVRRLAPGYRRLSLRKDQPHLEVHLPFPDPRSQDAGQYFEALQSLARAVNEHD